MIKANYKEFHGNNWDAEFVISGSECNVELEGKDKHEVFDDAVSKMNDTSNNAEICIFPFYIRSGKTISCWHFDGVDFVKTNKCNVLDFISLMLWEVSRIEE